MDEQDERNSTTEIIGTAPGRGMWPDVTVQARRAGKGYGACIIIYDAEGNEVAVPAWAAAEFSILVSLAEGRFTDGERRG